MKKHLTALFLGLAASTLLCFAQEKSPPAPAPDKPTPASTEPAAPATGVTTPADLVNTDTPGAPNAAPADKPAGGAAADAPAAKPDEPVPLIVIDDVPLTDAIRNLARQAGLNFQFDPRISASNQP